MVDILDIVLLATLTFDDKKYSLNFNFVQQNDVADFTD